MASVCLDWRCSARRRRARRSLERRLEREDELDELEQDEELEELEDEEELEDDRDRERRRLCAGLPRRDRDREEDELNSDEELDLEELELEEEFELELAELLLEEEDSETDFRRLRVRLGDRERDLRRDRNRRDLMRLRGGVRLCLRLASTLLLLGRAALAARARAVFEAGGEIKLPAESGRSSRTSIMGTSASAGISDLSY